MIDFNQLQTGKRVRARFARGDNAEGDAPDWKDPIEVTLHVERRQKAFSRGRHFLPAGEIISITIKDFVWAEYALQDYNEQYNEFTCEEYRMQILEILD